MSDDEKKILVSCAIHQTKTSMKLDELEKWKECKEMEDEKRDKRLSEVTEWQKKALLIIMIGTGAISILYDMFKSKLASFLGG